MKKIIIILTACFMTSGSIFAQHHHEKETCNRSNKCESILPQKGDIGISADFSPALKYLGNAFNNNADNSTPSLSSPNNPFSVTGRYFIQDNAAIRLRVGLNFLSQSNKKLVPDVSDPDKEVVDKTTNKSNDVNLLAGYELRRGYGRLQGFYGVEAGLNFMSSSINNTYGNPIGKSNPISRVLSQKNGGTFGLYAGGFVGVEYYVLPKVALSFEYALGLKMQPQLKGKVVTESWNNTDLNVKKETKESYIGTEYGEAGLLTNGQGKLSISFFF